MHRKVSISGTGAWTARKELVFKLTMLFRFVVHSTLSAEGLLDAREQEGLFILMVVEYEAMLGQAVADKVLVDSSTYTWRLLVNDVVATDHNIMADGPVRCLFGISIGLDNMLDDC